MITLIRRTTIITLVFLTFALDVFAPSTTTKVIIESTPIKPFTKLIQAVGMVETGFDTLAYNAVEEATGYFQIRPIRVMDYNQRTGNKYTLNDMYNYEIAEKFFLYYATIIGPGNFEKIAKSWNGSGPMTIHYWERVKKYL
jgi:hypothetical protein